jgi:hypothetical protein
MAQAGARTPMDEVTLETSTTTNTTNTTATTPLLPSSNHNGSSRQAISTPPSDVVSQVKSTVTAAKTTLNDSPVKSKSNTNAVAATTAKDTPQIADKKKPTSKPETSTDSIASNGFKCIACQLPIIDSGVRLPSGRLYHPHCFTCAGCGKEFKDSAFVNYGGRAYHPDVSGVIIIN